MSATAEDNGNGRVTMAVIGTKLDNLTDLVRGYCAEAEDREKRIGALERRADVNDEQHKIMSGIGVALSAVASAIGAWVK